MEGGLSGNVKVELPKTGEETSFYGEHSSLLHHACLTLPDIGPLACNTVCDYNCVFQMMRVAVMRSLWVVRL